MVIFLHLLLLTEALWIAITHQLLLRCNRAIKRASGHLLPLLLPGDLNEIGKLKGKQSKESEGRERDLRFRSVGLGR